MGKILEFKSTALARSPSKAGKKHVEKVDLSSFTKTVQDEKLMVYNKTILGKFSTVTAESGVVKEHGDLGRQDGT